MTEPARTKAAADDPERAARRRATWLLIALRTAYAYNWFDIGPALPGIGSELGVGPAGWGLLVGGFLVGAGALQVPAGLLAHRFGPRAVALWGAALLTVGAAASALAPTFAVLLATRVLAGAGAGLFFSPAIGLVGTLFPSGARGVPVGLFSSAFSLGAALGIFGSAALVPSFGWRGALALGAVVLGVLSVVAVRLVARRYGAAPAGPSSRPRPVPTAYRLREVWAIGLAFIGFEGATFATGQFVVPFGESVHGWAPVLAGAVGTAFVLPSVAGGPIGGVVAERSDRPRAWLVGATVAGGVVLLALPWIGVAATLAVGVTFSFAYGFVYAVMYVLPHRWPQLPAGEIPLAIGLFNALQLGGGAVVALLFGLAVDRMSYAFAWPLVGVVQLATLVALVGVPARFGGGRPVAEAVGPR